MDADGIAVSLARQMASELGSADGCELGFADENGRRWSRMDADGLEWT